MPNVARDQPTPETSEQSQRAKALAAALPMVPFVLLLRSVSTQPSWLWTPKSDGSSRAGGDAVCDLVKDRTYDGARVTFHARVLDGQLHGILLKDDRCDKGLRMTASDSVREQEDYNKFMSTIYSSRKSSVDQTITADFYGKFVYRPAEPRLKWALMLSESRTSK